MTTKDAIKHLSYKISYCKAIDEKWADSVNIDALDIAVRAMAEEQKKVRYIDAEELKHILNNSKYYGTKAGNAFADMIAECETIKENINVLLPIQPKQKKGKWIKRGVSLYRCSECGRFSPSQENYCPSCGSYNGEEKDNA